MGLRLIARALASIAVAALLAAGGALAAQVSTDEHCETHGGGKGCSFVTTARYAAAPGEANDLTVSRETTSAAGETGAWVFRDFVPVQAGEGCQSRSAVEVVCPATRGVVQLGDGADRARGQAIRIEPSGSFHVSLSIDGGDGPDSLTSNLSFLVGGAGDDELQGQTLSGGPGADRLTGTVGNDYLDGGAGLDELRAGEGDDTLAGDGGSPYDADRPAQPSQDLLDGGAGSDAADYQGHRVPVEVRVADGIGGAEGEADRLVAIESAIGGDASDLLVGDDGPNRLHGGGSGPGFGLRDDDVLIGLGGDDQLSGDDGNDFHDGGAGDDRVQGGAGHDALDGGPGDDLVEGASGSDRFSAGDGNDLIYVADLSGGAEPVDCGAGFDTIIFPFVALLEGDCEAITFLRDMPSIRAHPVPAGRSRLAFKLACPKPRACTGRLRLRLAGRSTKEFFADRSWSSSTGRARVAVDVPASIRERPGERLPVVVDLDVRQRTKHTPLYSLIGVGVWSFDLRSVPGFGR